MKHEAETNIFIAALAAAEETLTLAGERTAAAALTLQRAELTKKRDDLFAVGLQPRHAPATHRQLEIDLIAAALQAALERAESRGHKLAALALLQTKINLEREWRDLEKARAKGGGT